MARQHRKDHLARIVGVLQRLRAGKCPADGLGPGRGGTGDQVVIVGRIQGCVLDIARVVPGNAAVPVLRPFCTTLHASRKANYLLPDHFRQLLIGWHFRLFGNVAFQIDQFAKTDSELFRTGKDRALGKSLVGPLDANRKDGRVDLEREFYKAALELLNLASWTTRALGRYAYAPPGPQNPEHGAHHRQVEDVAIYREESQGTHEPASLPIVKQFPFARRTGANDELGARASSGHSRIKVAGMIQDRDHGPVQLQNFANVLASFALQPEVHLEYDSKGSNG